MGVHNHSAQIIIVSFIISVGEDFTAISTSQTFQPSQTDAECVSVSINGDAIPEEDESLTLMLSSTDPDVMPNIVSTVGIIVDDDGMHFEFS